EQKQRHRNVKRVANVELYTSFKHEGGKKENQDHIRGQPVRPQPGLQGSKVMPVKKAEQQSAENQGDRIRNSQALRQYRNRGGSDEQPDQEFYGRACSHPDELASPTMFADDLKSN